jgi:hypothetical protein
MEHLFNPVQLLIYQKTIVRHPWLGFDHDENRMHPIASSLRQYATNRGWTESQLNRIGDDPYSFGLTGLAMLQSMLFFGIWESVIGESMSSEDFLVGSPANRKLSSENLRPLLRETSEALDRGKPTSVKDLAALESKSQQICRVMEEVESWESVLLGPHPVQFSLAISVLQRQTALAREALNFLHRWIPPEKTHNRPRFRHLNVNEGFTETYCRRTTCVPRITSTFLTLGSVLLNTSALQVPSTSQSQSICLVVLVCVWRTVQV